MNQRLLVSSIVATAAAVTLTACASSSPAPHASAAAGNGTGASSTPASRATATTSAAAAPAGEQATRLAATLKQSLAEVKSLHLSLHVTAGGIKVTGSGDERLAAGKLQAFQLTERIPGGQTIRLVYVDGKFYAKVPREMNKSGKPYVLVSPNSSDPMLRGIARSLDSALQSASVQSANVYARVASSVRDLGKTTVNGQQATHYAVVIDPAKLPAGLPGMSKLAGAGIKSIPVDMYLDSQNRPVQISLHLGIRNESSDSVVTISRYNQPVSISAPPAGQVATR